MAFFALGALATPLLGSAGAAASSAASGALAGAVSSATGALTGAVSSAVGSIFGNLSGPTGAAQVHFINDSNPHMSGNSFWYGKELGLKWRDMDAFFKAYNNGNGLESFGWELNKVPSSASAKFKSAEDRFFEIIDLYAEAVANGSVTQDVWHGTAFDQWVDYYRGGQNGTVSMPMSSADGTIISGGSSSPSSSDTTTILTYIGIGLTVLSFLKKR